MSQHSILLAQAHAQSVGITMSHEGGAVYSVDPMVHLRRFLALGSTGTYYAGPWEVTREADATVHLMIAAHPREVLDLVLEMAAGNIVVRRDPLIYTLALLTRCDDLAVKRDAVNAVAEVCRTGTDFLHWVAFRFADRKSNRTFRRAVSQWFTERDPGYLALQAVKYDQRDGWSLRDAMRLARPTASGDRDILFDWIAHPDRRSAIGAFADVKLEHDGARRLIAGYAAIREDGITPEQAAEIVREHRLPREVVPAPMLAHSEVWRALLPDMPGRALLRNLGKLTSLKLDRDKDALGIILGKIEGATKICNPLEFLLAYRVYRKGCGVRGSLIWSPNTAICDALLRGYSLAFGELPVRTGRRILIAIDVSGSMTWDHGDGRVVTPMEAATALALILAYQYPGSRMIGFDTGSYEITTASEGYEHLRAVLERFGGGGTDCAIPFSMAASDKSITDMVILTDSETSWYASRKLAEIRRSRPEFRIAVVAMALNKISIADPADPLAIDVAGLEASLPRTLDLFLSGQV